MSQAKSSVLSPAVLRRVIGEYGREGTGPTVIFIGGIHGNEPAGIQALQTVTRQLHRRQPEFRGKFLALAGNLSALSRSTRYLARDLNRIWTPERMQTLEQGGYPAENENPEYVEQRELFSLLRPLLPPQSHPVYLIDLHTTSAPSAPFIILFDALRNRLFAQNFPIPLILGMEEHLSGTLLNWVDELGVRTVAIEAGQHEAPESVAIHVAAIWLALVFAGCLPREAVPEFREHLATLRQAGAGHPRVFDVRYRYAIRSGEQFRMEPGFRNFHPVKRGQVLARNAQGFIHSPMAGYVFMPLYQNKGNDGFFLIRRISALWLKISELLRRAKVDRWVVRFPGVRQDSRYPRRVWVNRRIARWGVPELFHLLGYRREYATDSEIVFLKRAFDLPGQREK